MNCAFKLCLHDEVRRVTIPESTVSFAKLFETAKNLFPVLKSNPGKISLEWVDDDNDSVLVSSDEEFMEALRIMESQELSALRFNIILTGDETGYSLFARKEPEEKMEHPSIRCDECDAFPIIGIRYKCSIRKNYDLCSSCEAKSIQPYPMIKIYNPNQAPTAIYIAVSDYINPPGSNSDDHLRDIHFDSLHSHHGRGRGRGGCHHHGRGPRHGSDHHHNHGRLRCGGGGRGHGKESGECKHWKHFVDKAVNTVSDLAATAVDMAQTHLSANKGKEEEEALLEIAMHESLKDENNTEKSVDHVSQDPPHKTSLESSPVEEVPIPKDEEEENYMLEIAKQESLSQVIRTVCPVRDTNSIFESKEMEEEDKYVMINNPLLEKELHIINGLTFSKEVYHESNVKNSSEVSPKSNLSMFICTNDAEVLPDDSNNVIDSNHSSITTPSSSHVPTVTPATAASPSPTQVSLPLSNATDSVVDSTHIVSPMKTPLDELVNSNIDTSVAAPTVQVVQSPAPSHHMSPISAHPEVLPDSISGMKVEATSPVSSVHSTDTVLWAVELNILADMGFNNISENIPLLRTYCSPATSVSGVEPNLEGIQRVVNNLLSF
mmetsp:Transcript_34407/g.35076  ORF Transcript_34407/g.35076 Transcript_34407/m.35076 type:complete len:605 (+) Transcript_34407:99-1913(+)|eukprot:CAMPEP_0182427236 /NCGR_PEP_ID=MMETSP1167-20130531/16166_1 /TAXON_ID=2988 /ORGANISM="Mallomonas Sp, Strain CCMP3275" /LENGTH=604 /DNA_ID=CAMNT_0024609333 /DNA_START=93 /DNA_END=1907 /DNA_ORIENTATION=+